MSFARGCVFRFALGGTCKKPVSQDSLCPKHANMRCSLRNCRMRGVGSAHFMKEMIDGHRFRWEKFYLCRECRHKAPFRVIRR